MPRRLRFLAISGSLRARATNAELLRALARLAGPVADVAHYDGLAKLPHFNPDLDAEGMIAPEPVQALRRAVADADVVIISSPEYAHGVPGALKNALDWLVSGPEIVAKPVSLLNPSPHSLYAHPALAETLRTMSARLIDDACLTLPIVGRGLDAESMIADRELRDALEGAIGAMGAAVAGMARASEDAHEPQSTSSEANLNGPHLP